jgi:hypothetical protein
MFLQAKSGTSLPEDILASIAEKAADLLESGRLAVVSQGLDHLTVAEPGHPEARSSNGCVASLSVSAEPRCQCGTFAAHGCCEHAFAARWLAERNIIPFLQN